MLSKIHDNGDEHGEGLVLVGLQDVEEVIVLEEAHGTIGDLKMVSTNGSDDALEEAGNQVLNLLNFANFKDFLKFSQEESFLDAVGKWPVLEEAFEERDSQSAVLG